MSQKPLLAVAVIAAVALGATAAAACPFNAAQNDDPSKVASSAPAQDGTAAQPSSTN
jgi:hypothetical protein